MGRLIDADAFKKKVCTYQQTGCGDCKHSLCCPEDAPTVDAISKADYENRLKADMVAMLKELEKELKEVKCNYLATIHIDIAEEYFNLAKVEGLYLIQQKINKLQEIKDEKK